MSHSQHHAVNWEWERDQQNPYWQNIWLISIRQAACSSANPPNQIPHQYFQPYGNYVIYQQVCSLLPVGAVEVVATVECYSISFREQPTLTVSCHPVALSSDIFLHCFLMESRSSCSYYNSITSEGQDWCRNSSKSGSHASDWDLHSIPRKSLQRRVVSCELFECIATHCQQQEGNFIKDMQLCVKSARIVSYTCQMWS